ncbi:hypothetical protein [Pseudodonghicola flavimaris]|uniref:DUF2157 domain-containing protein n=1 Tax=Pseudodonghicola flavimaris TaxID=3050036 RepID=A0ABT7F081_9RHOB|nr:hypothetical protein [Pseudodonghicola flavimaris]MDK3018011.1 hypothetical protein [Pseudodonghicola flavimaris]
MKYLADTEELIRDGILSEPQAAEIARRSREAMIALAINIVLFCGLLAVIAGMAAYLDDAAQLTLLGAAVTLAGGIALLLAGEAYRLLANATAVIGAAMLVGGGAFWLVQARGTPDAAAVLGVPVALLGYLCWRVGPSRLRFLTGWLCFLGVAVHLAGLLAQPALIAPQWLVYHYAGVALVLCGLALDIRLITALSMLAFAAALSSRSFYATGAYAVAIYECTLTILQMGVLGGLCLWAMRRCPDRRARHAEILGRLAFIWLNMAFWIGSIWGDTVGATLWGPRWARFSEIPYWQADAALQAEFRTAREAFVASALHIPETVYAIAWAVLLAGTVIWAAMGARRALFNTAVTFGAIHLYTQYFERIDTTPGSIVIAGLIAIALAYATWRLNAHLKARAGEGARARG